jgi:transcription-repair coupling factor (superfamily II helicase)
MSRVPSTADLREALDAELSRVASLRWRLQGLGEGSAAHVFGSLITGLTRPILLLVPTQAHAEAFAIELQTVLGEKPGADFLTRRVHVFPAREAPPLEMISPPLELEAARSAALFQLAQLAAPIVIASVPAIMQRTETPQELLSSSLYLAAEQELEMENFVPSMVDIGYRRVGLVEEPGEIAARGGIIDIWPAGSEYPCRVELYGDVIDSLRHFDPADQRSFGVTEQVAIMPAGSCATDVLGNLRVRDLVHERCSDLLLAAGERRELAAALASGIRFPGVELLSCYARDDQAWIGDFLTDSAIVTLLDPASVDAALEDTSVEIKAAEQAASAAGTFFPQPELLYADQTAARELLERRPLIELDLTQAVESVGTAGDRIWRVETRGNESVSAARARVSAGRGDSRFQPMADELRKLSSGSRVIVLASDATQLARLEHLLQLAGIENIARADTYSDALAADARKLWLVHGHLDRGFRMASDSLVVVTDEEIFGQRRRPTRRRRASKARALTALAEIEPGDFMVHVDHGIGVYRGLKHLVAGGTEGDFIFIEYSGGDRYYLPVDRINLVEKYTGSGGNPPLAKLGGVAWVRTKQRAKASILEMARELLDLEAFRAVHDRERFVEAGADFEEFEAHFPFEETDGQKTAITDIVGDLTSGKPMDRVVCGDVGYGKTEVAMRGAYLTVMGGRQVAFLVPTTVLARQHHDSLVERFENYPVKIGMLSRFQSRERNAETIAALEAGTLDIVVGTHRMLQHDVRFARLGLLVIDEEHRFGVKAKERVKKMRREIDVLTMTATPIPRTLQLALSGVRDLSLIETPPVDRLAIRTYVARYDEGLIKQSLDRELGRGGQAFFVHNRVQSIEAIARRLRELVPKARIGVAHGQMKEGDLERVMIDFLAHDYDVLVCSSIIESGLDIPNANTILVNRADTFGLAQLYQIRGRVGRSHRRAYAYLLVPGEKLITEDARRRLAVLQDLDELGSGFRVAAHDMEIRGAGNLLGKEQSGHVAAVGFELFMQMMDEAANELRGSPTGPRVEPEIELGSEAFIPDDYIGDIRERLLIYKRMANVETRESLDAIGEELADRFGPVPQQVEDFISIMALRPALKRLGIESLRASGATVAFRFHEDSPIERARLVGMMTEQPQRFKMRPGGGFTMALEGGAWDAMVDEIERFLDVLIVGALERSRPEEEAEEDVVPHES